MNKESSVIIRDGNNWTVLVEGKSVARCVVDITFFSISFIERDECIEILIENKFLLTVGNTETLLSHETPISLGEALVLLKQPCEVATINEAGKLSLNFAGGLGLTVESHKDYEAWQILKNDILRVVCMPGGELSIWSEV